MNRDKLFTTITLPKPEGHVEATETVVGALDGIKATRKVYRPADAKPARIPRRRQVLNLDPAKVAEAQRWADSIRAGLS